MAAKGSASGKADAFENLGKEVEGVTYQELNRMPNIHVLRKPAWYTGKTENRAIRLDLVDNVQYERLLRWDEAPLDTIAPVEYQRIDMAGSFWKSVISVPMLVLLALPLLAALSFTLFSCGALPGAIARYLFSVSQGTGSPAILAGFWAIALVAFIPWSASICRLESFVSQYLG